MNLYQKLPVIVEARRLDFIDNGLREIIEWVNGSGGAARQKPGFDAVEIDTLEGTMTAGPGDWIVRGVQGEFYPVKPEIFEATYEPAITDAELDSYSLLTLARFTSPNFAVKDARGEGAEALRKHFHRAALAIILASGPTKSRAVALTELETAMMWAIKAYYGAPGEGDGS